MITSVFLLCLLAATAAADALRSLACILSADASISTNQDSAPRWSDYYAPKPGYIVHVAEELDVAKTISYCNAHGHKYLAQSGGHGWARTFDLGKNDILIDLRGLNSIEFNEARDQVTVGGGAINGEWVDAALASGRQVLNGGCNCVGVLGATLGGGVSRWMGHYGMPIDNVISGNLVTAEGAIITISRDSYPDLFWAVLGAGANFGVITSAVMRAFPLIDDGVIWTGELLFTGDKLEPFIEAINNLNLTENMALLWGFGARESGIVITAQVSYTSSDPQQGRDAFRALYDLDPDDETTKLLEYNHINDDTEFLCEPGGRKPGWFTGMRTFDYPAFQTIWDEFIAFVDETGLDSTTILIECYSSWVLRDIGSDYASYAHRDIDYYAWILFNYEDEEHDNAVEMFGSRVRELWRETSGFNQQRTYINFAYGDDALSDIYGDSLPRLRELKEEWDPNGRLNQWFGIS